MNNQKELTELFACDYVNWRMKISVDNDEYVDFECDISDAICPKTRDIALIIRQLALRLETSNNRLFEQLDKLDLTVISSRHVFFGILLELVFEDRREAKTRVLVQTFDCNWARILATFSLAGYLAYRESTANCQLSGCSKSLQEPTTTSKLASWLSQFLNNEPYVFEWIETNDGWVMVYFKLYQ
jgi:hypothetical protein